MAADDIGTQRTHPLDEGAPEVVRIGELAVGEAEVLHAGEAGQGRRRLELGRPPGRQLHGHDTGIGRPLAAVGAHDQVHGSPRLGPAGERPATGDVGIVGMGVDGNSTPGVSSITSASAPSSW